MSKAENTEAREPAPVRAASPASEANPQRLHEARLAEKAEREREAARAAERVAALLAARQAARDEAAAHAAERQAARDEAAARTAEIKVANASRLAEREQAAARAAEKVAALLAARQAARDEAAARAAEIKAANASRLAEREQAAARAAAKVTALHAARQAARDEVAARAAEINAAAAATLKRLFGQRTPASTKRRLRAALAAARRATLGEAPQIAPRDILVLSHRIFEPPRRINVAPWSRSRVTCPSENTDRYPHSICLVDLGNLRLVDEIRVRFPVSHVSATQPGITVAFSADLRNFQDLVPIKTSGATASYECGFWVVRMPKTALRLVRVSQNGHNAGLEVSAIEIFAYVFDEDPVT